MTSSGDQLGNRGLSGGRNSAQSNPAKDMIAQAYAKRRQLDQSKRSKHSVNAKKSISHSRQSSYSTANLGAHNNSMLQNRNRLEEDEENEGSRNMSLDMPQDEPVQTDDQEPGMQQLNKSMDFYQKRQQLMKKPILEYQKQSAN